ncbi:hypothetical protein N8T08_007074 [Aspergillus melleus]|uniref:Uncharacterized protein n=1 Tax=Aspergillus melleus TaxID=138277 RepID=A0ACC3AYP5_9EURO|nr:hypothetical protein N8T08_007074 [Aspergillus melleus]
MWSSSDNNLFKNRVLFKAGFGERAQDRVITIPEPQAAAYTVFRKHQSEFKVHDRVLICDLGGGTANFSSYYVTSMKPVTVRSISDGIGFLCGGTAIDKFFYLELSRSFGSDWNSIPVTLKGQGSLLMRDFERIKTKFDGSTTPTTSHEIKILGRKISKILGRPRDAVVLTPEMIRRFFDPVISRIKGLIEEQLKKAMDQPYPFMNKIVLVGGLSSSPYVQQQLLGTFNQPDKLKVITTLNPELAVAHDLVYHGLETQSTGVQKSPQFYGIGSGPLRVATFPDQQHKGDTMKVRERVEWVLSKHGEYTPQFCHRMEKTIFHTHPRDTESRTVLIYSCDLSTGPEHVDDHGVNIAGLIMVELSELPPGYLSYGQNIIPAVICTTPGPELHTLKITVEVEGHGDHGHPVVLEQYVEPDWTPDLSHLEPIQIYSVEPLDPDHENLRDNLLHTLCNDEVLPLFGIYSYCPPDAFGCMEHNRREIAHRKQQHRSEASNPPPLIRLAMLMI